MNKQTAPLYGIVSDLRGIPIGKGMQQALPSIRDLQAALDDGHMRLVGGYEVLLSEYLRKTEAASEDGKLGEEAMTIDKSTRCPLCGEGRLLRRSQTGSQWSCGTEITGDAGEYDTGTECDLIRYKRIVEKIADLDFTDLGATHVSCMMPRKLLDELRKECER